MPPRPGLQRGHVPQTHPAGPPPAASVSLVTPGSPSVCPGSDGPRPSAARWERAGLWGPGRGSLGVTPLSDPAPSAPATLPRLPEVFLEHSCAVSSPHPPALRRKRQAHTHPTGPFTVHGSGSESPGSVCGGQGP